MRRPRQSIGSLVVDQYLSLAKEWTLGAHSTWRSLNNPGRCQDRNCPKTDSGAPLWRATFTQFIEYREAKVVLSWRLYSYVLVSLAWRGTLKVMERQTWTIATKPLTYNILPERCAGGNDGTELVGVANQYLVSLRPMP
ncbi:hypothetical protein I79_007330 [Cricetulus griseus]|uniref:Uncharacterized protein n=1 Tax=Cricetulus griseus TaxID=10029 RepID=G3HA85_CRIGR|nr:hypothetical protein I79_007330 [Cricetulus griseus]